MYLSIYVCIIYPAFVAPRFPRFVYVLKFSVYWHAWFTTEQQWSYSCLPWRLSTKTGRWMRRHMVQTHHSAYWDSGAVAARQLAGHLCDESKTTDELTVFTAVLWRLYWQRHDTKLTTCTVLAYRVICGCRAIQTNSTETISTAA